MSRNTHELDAPHFGELSAIRVLLDEAIGVFSAGDDLETVLRYIYDLIERAENATAFGSYRIVDDAADVEWVPVNALTSNTVATATSVGAASFTGNPIIDFDDLFAWFDQGILPDGLIDPIEMSMWNGDNTSAYSGWLGLAVESECVIRMYTIGGPIGDTLMALFGPYSSPTTPPSTTEVPLHFGDDNNPLGGFQTSLHDRGSEPTGTLYPGFLHPNSNDTVFSEDTKQSGVRLSRGFYWLAIWPYDGYGWDTGEGELTIYLVRRGDPTFTANAILRKNQAFSLTADAVLRAAEGSFTADAVILDGDALVWVDAVIKKNQSGSFTTDAVIDITNDFSSDFDPDDFA